MTTFVLKFVTTGFLNILDITDQVRECVQKAKYKEGLVTIFSRHTTAAIKINEVEKGFFADFKKFCQKFVPAKDIYAHNDLHHRDSKTICADREECLNGHSHILQMFIGTASETIPLSEGKLLLGRWQRILLIELDAKREREIVVKIV